MRIVTKDKVKVCKGGEVSSKLVWVRETLGSEK